MTREAHYTNISATTKRMHPWAKGEVSIAQTADGRREFTGETAFVTGKVQARQIAKELGATPWNF